MNKKAQYAIAHKLAKFIIFAFNTSLLLLDIDMTLALVVINFTYFFGVNSIAYLIENLLHFRHKHDKI